MTAIRAIPCPPATARVGWTLYDATGAVVGWVRRSESCDESYGRPAGMFWTIPRVGLGDPANYVNVRHAAMSPFLVTA
jgi:hypothetical protein